MAEPKTRKSERADVWVTAPGTKRMLLGILVASGALLHATFWSSDGLGTFAASLALAGLWLFAALRLPTRQLGVGPSGLFVAHLGPTQHVAWSDLESLEVVPGRGGPRLGIQRRGGPRLDVRLRGYPDRTFTLLRQRVSPGIYRLSQADELALVGSRSIAIHRAPIRARPVPQAPVGYRERAEPDAPASVPVVTRADLRVPFPSEARHLRRHRIATFAGLGLVLLVGSSCFVFERAFGVAWLLGNVALLSGLLWVSAVRRRPPPPAAGLRRYALDRLGADVRLDARGMIVRADGTARLRQLPDDLHDPWAGPHFHFEELDPETGVTKATSAEIGDDLELPGEMEPFERREIARVVSPRATNVLLAETGSKRPFRDLHEATTVLVLDSGPSGAVLRRLGQNGLHLGDTFHESAGDARRQAEREHEHEPWRAVPLDDPWTIEARLR